MSEGMRFSEKHTYINRIIDLHVSRHKSRALDYAAIFVAEEVHVSIIPTPIFANTRKKTDEPEGANWEVPLLCRRGGMVANIPR